MSAATLPVRLAPFHPAPPGLVGVADPAPARVARPLLPVRVTCGFPSPAEDFYGAGDELDLNERCIGNPVATFFVEADTGTSMVDIGIFPGDTLIVDRSLTAKHGDVAMVLWEGGFMVKQLILRGRRIELHSANKDSPPIMVSPEMELDVWGVVTWSLRRHLRR